MSRCIKTAIILWVGYLALAAPLLAQLQLGNDLNLRLNGTLSAGYNGDYGNQTSSDHNLGVAGSAAASGYFFNPNFLSFNVNPYYNQARDNSSYRSISDSSGVDASSQIFAGSAFPVSLSFSKAYNSEGNYAIPGLANYVSHGNSETIGASWAMHLPNLPNLAVTFQRSAGQNTAYGTSEESSSTSRSLTLSGSYALEGFHFGGGYSLGAGDGKLPEFLAGTQQVLSESSGAHSYNFSVSHKLPWNGSAFASFSKSSSESSFLENKISSSEDSLNAEAAFQPTQKLHLSITTQYSDNLSAELSEAVVAAGGVVQQSTQSPPSHGYLFNGTASYSLLPNMPLQGSAERRVQLFDGITLGENLYGGNTSYVHGLLGGSIGGAISVSDSTVDGSSLNVLGFSGNGSYNRRIGHWKLNATFSYNQNVETLLIAYTSSSYGYSASVSRHWNQVIWTFGASGARSGLTVQQGTAFNSEGANSSISFGRWFSANGNYSKSSGDSILTASGLVATPVPTPTLPSSSEILYGGTSYSASVSSSPIKRFTLAASYAKAKSNTSDALNSSTNTSEMFNSIFQYQFRKMGLVGGFSRLTQGFSASGSAPQAVSSFYIGVNRWFNFF